MKYRNLGASPLKVSALCLGSRTFGDQTDAAEAGPIGDAAKAQGVNCLDTADVYSRGGSETLPKLHRPRDQVVARRRTASR